MIEFLIELDIKLFLFLNSLHSPFFDPIMVFISSKFGWIPLYAFIIFLLFKKYKWQTFMIFAFVVLLIFISDQSSVKLFKEVFKRLRPCHNESLANLVHTVNNKCGGMYSFVSSHATNTFALAMFTSLLLNYRIYSIGIFVWAAVVSYSRVYLGVHFTADIIGGAILGMLCGYLVYWLYIKFGRKWCKNSCARLIDFI